MKSIKLSGKTREITKKSMLKAMRREGQIPCVLYGHNVENLHFSVEERELLQILNTPNSYIVELDVDGKTHKAVFHSAQYHPVTDEPLHIDFLSVTETKPVVISVPVVITGNSEGVRQGGKLILTTRKVKISAPIDKLPDDITVDISNLNIGKSIFAGDINIDGVQVITPASTIICTVKMTRAAIGAAAAAAAAAAKK
ncbi:MAG: 50S ribosomal protein L25 [Bacteroidia bacterium]|uniref:50S ribosomal protein L25 n=1 Tax=bioreactor metagenome TaxID=1076179 RepID=A0A644X910_9ZZZZ|nr:50S ribosomal protein L25 [Rikenellaceae bacterium]NCB18623.1 50S ribosomal protein L25 [Bacteroidia bacterium]